MAKPAHAQQLSFRDRAIAGLPDDLVRDLDAWAAADGVRPNDPAWLVVGLMVRSAYVASQHVTQSVASAGSKGQEGITKAIGAAAQQLVELQADARSQLRGDVQEVIGAAAERIAAVASHQIQRLARRRHALAAAAMLALSSLVAAVGGYAVGAAAQREALTLAGIGWVERPRGAALIVPTRQMVSCGPRERCVPALRHGDVWQHWWRRAKATVTGGDRRR